MNPGTGWNGDRAVQTARYKRYDALGGVWRGFTLGGRIYKVEGLSLLLSFVARHLLGWVCLDRLVAIITHTAGHCTLKLQDIYYTLCLECISIHQINLFDLRALRYKIYTLQTHELRQICLKTREQNKTNALQTD